MTSRPHRWDLLDADGDPVPADPDLIEDEGDHYTKVARSIEQQVARLRALAEEDVILEGKYADALQESCRETADELDKAHGRFATVGSELSSWWGPAVRTARDATGVQVLDAEDAHRRIRPTGRSARAARLARAHRPQKDAADAKPRATPAPTTTSRTQAPLPLHDVRARRQGRALGQEDPRRRR